MVVGHVDHVKHRAPNFSGFLPQFMAFGARGWHCPGWLRRARRLRPGGKVLISEVGGLRQSFYGAGVSG
jgi:hypothetical protein